MLHSEGHWNRPRNRVNGNGLGAFADHEVVELLLTYLRDRWGRRPRLGTWKEIGRFVVDELATADNEIFLLVALPHENHPIRPTCTDDSVAAQDLRARRERSGHETTW